VFRAGWEWIGAQGTAELVGPDDQLPGISSEDLPRVLRTVYASAAGGLSDDWASLDEPMAAERHTAVLMRVARLYPAMTWADPDPVVAGQWPAPSGAAELDGDPSRSETGSVSEREIDEYLAALDETKRGTLERLRRTILEVIPDAEQCISYGMPAFKLDGKAVAGFAAFKNHLSYFPHSGSVLPELSDDLVGYTASKGTLQFPIDKPLPKTLVRKLIAVRRRQLGGR
jgi:uncharacterized protein YdhG (YjbR/CyaY superfamily)